MQNPEPANDARVRRLQQYLLQDPDNGELLAATCDAAIEAGAHECVQGCIASARTLNLPWPPWAERTARLALERAIADFQRGDMGSARDQVAAWVTGDEPREPLESWRLPMQVLWLRATHRCGLVLEAVAWAQRQGKQGSLHPAAAGVASLAAVDTDDFKLAERLAGDALQAGAASQEALVALASVALARRDAGAAKDLLRQALSTSPDEGRTHSLMGLVHLQARDFAQAQASFETALATMPAHVGTWHGLGWARLLQGDRARAADAFDRALELDRNFAESHGAVGLMLLLAGRGREANHHLDLADRLDRANVTGRYARALVAGEAGHAQALHALADRLLDRPGLFGRRLRDDFASHTKLA
jgi:Tfp pilus assembly protein PilF